MHKHIALFFVVSALSGCTEGVSKSSTSPIVSGHAPVTSGAWTEVARLPGGSRYGVNVVNRGFGVAANGEIVLAGGQESQINQGVGQPRDDVEFYSTTTASTDAKLERTSKLPKALISPKLVTLGNTLYVLNGYTQTATFPATSQQVWRYQPASNDFASEANDPGVATTSSYYVTAAGSIYRITPPFAFRGPTQLGSVGKFTPGTGWTDTPLSAPIPQNGQVCVVGNQLYVFGGRMFSANDNADVYRVDLATAQVTKIGAQTKLRLDGLAIESAGEIHLIGGGASGPSAPIVPTPAEAFTIGNAQVRDRPDLESFFFLSQPQISGDLVYVYDPRGNGYTVFRYRP